MKVLHLNFYDIEGGAAVAMHRLHSLLKKNNSIEFLNELGNPYDTIIVDKNGLISISFGAYGVPETYLVNSNEKILKRYIGPLNEDNINELLKIINEKL